MRENLFEIILLKALPNLTKKQIRNFERYSKSSKLYLKHKEVLEKTEKDFRLVNDAISKLPEGTLEKVRDEILNPIKEIISDFENGEGQKDTS